MATHYGNGGNETRRDTRCGSAPPTEKNTPTKKYPTGGDAPFDPQEIKSRVTNATKDRSRTRKLPSNTAKTRPFPTQFDFLGQTLPAPWPSVC
jgi:hypothetical protein